eukprot:scaffold1400_cov175-Amphora_coffeaeformis.AAC.5
MLFEQPRNLVGMICSTPHCTIFLSIESKSQIEYMLVKCSPGRWMDSTSLKMVAFVRFSEDWETVLWDRDCTFGLARGSNRKFPTQINLVTYISLAVALKGYGGSR